MALTEREREILEESMKRHHDALVKLSGEPVENGENPGED